MLRNLNTSAIFKMAKSLLLCLILAETFLCLAMATGENTQPPLHSEAAAAFSNPPASSPSISHDSHTAEAPSIRKLGRHQSAAAAAFSPSEAPSEESTDSSDETKVAENLDLQGKEILDMKKNHHSVDKSVAGGGVILGGLATTFFVAVFCYIRATRRHKAADTNQIQTTV